MSRITREEYEEAMRKVDKKAGGIARGIGKAGMKVVGATLKSFTGKGQFKGIVHPDSLIDEKTKWLYCPRHGRRRKRSMKELYFGQRDE